MAAAPLTPTPEAAKAARTLTADATDIIVIIPQEGGVVRVDQPSARGEGREVFSCAPQTIGRLMARLDADPMAGADYKWLDLLSTSTPGVATSMKKGAINNLLSFPPRVKTVRQRIGGHDKALTLHLPATIWLQMYNLTERLAKSHLWAAPSRVASVADQVQVIPCPFGNVFTGHASLCWGNVVTSPLKPHDPVACDNLFWGTDFNDHLVQYNMFENPATPGQTFPSFAQWSTFVERNPTTALAIRWANAGPQPFPVALRRALAGQED